MRPPAKWILLVAILALCGANTPAPAFEAEAADGGLAFEACGDQAAGFVACGPSSSQLVLSRPGLRPTSAAAFAPFLAAPERERTQSRFPPEPKARIGQDLPLAVIVVELLI